MSTRRREPPASSMPELRTSPVAVVAPATSANLGPGFDALGLTLGLYDTVEAGVAGDGLTIEVDGEGAGEVPLDERHLVVRSLRAGLAALGAEPAGLRVRCHNVIPHGRGLGSSAAAIVSGLRLAEALVVGARWSRIEVLSLATRLEGHPDNVAACLFGGLTVAWTTGGSAPDSVSLAVHPDVRPVVFVPPSVLSTHMARSLLPAQVSHASASANAGRAALVVAALTTEPAHLLAATHDELHQEYRRAAMPESLDLVDRLRGAGIAAVVSGAGPSVLAMVTRAELIDAQAWTPPGWTELRLPVDALGARVA